MKSDIPKVSIVVPIYNVEDYLEECLEVWSDRLWKILKLYVLMMDQQTDQWKFLKTYAAADARIIVVDKKNGIWYWDEYWSGQSYR